MDAPAGLVESAFFKLLGCRLHSLGDGVAQVALSLEPPLRNRGGKLHGGALFSLVDIAMGLACSSVHGFDQQSATARVIHPGRRTLVVEAEVMQGDKLVAKAQGTFAVL
ncbi:PaaI family thioesterase [Pseudomonas sp. MPDS]|uniref:PaaI family thioesterase n=1 Tax=Pseudomonas sp. MPDS TaxID=2762896 RepID=UPI0015657798|nr:PaaI family thioesterase [Pseudomonas sp. MPDS]QKJ33750.1 PaaI family thioesterase [Pseudomonas sp. MPDS]